eukprot:1151979-Pelagomonas_calceolata.AAC.2
MAHAFVLAGLVGWQLLASYKIAILLLPVPLLNVELLLPACLPMVPTKSQKWNPRIMAPYLSKFLPLCARRLEGCPFKPFQTVCGIKFNCFLQLVGKDCALDFIIIYGQLNMPTANANCKGTTRISDVA